MSWSFSHTGNAKEVLAEAQRRFSEQKCAEPEEGIKGNVLNILHTSLSAMGEDVTVTVNAYGSQASTSEGHFNNNLQLSIGYVVMNEAERALTGNNPHAEQAARGDKQD